MGPGPIVPRTGPLGPGPQVPLGPGPQVPLGTTPQVPLGTTPQVPLGSRPTISAPSGPPLSATPAGTPATSPATPATTIPRGGKAHRAAERARMRVMNAVKMIGQQNRQEAPIVQKTRRVTP